MQTTRAEARGNAFNAFAGLFFDVWGLRLVFLELEVLNVVARSHVNPNGAT
jgi:hypothetical protein